MHSPVRQQLWNLHEMDFKRIGEQELVRVLIQMKCRMILLSHSYVAEIQDVYRDRLC